MSDYQKIENLIAEGKLNPIYLKEEFERESMLTILPTHTLTGKLLRYSTGRIELSQEQLNALISDIATVKSIGLWDSKTEAEALEQHKKQIEIEEQYKQLSASDKAKYDAEQLKYLKKQFNM